MKPKMNADTKLTIVMWCRVLIIGTQRYLVAVSAGSINLQATCLPVSEFLHGSARARPGEAGTIKQRSFNYVYHKGSVFPPIEICSISVTFFQCT